MKTLGAKFTCQWEPWREKKMYMAPVELEGGGHGLVPNGCDDYTSGRPECEECLKESFLDFKKWVERLSPDIPGKK